MADNEQVADSETSVTKGNGTEKPDQSELKDLLAEFDGKVSKSFEAPPEDAEIVLRDPEEIAAFEKRIESLEGDNTVLETEKSELTERADQAEKMADDVEAQALRIDQHDHDQLVKRLASETGISEHAAKMELKQRLEENKTFLADADGRFDNPDAFEASVEVMINEVTDAYPPRGDADRGAVAAYRMARTAHIGGGTSDEHEYGNFSTMNDHEFARQSEKVFADMRSGKLRAESSGPRGGCLRTGPS